MIKQLLNPTSPKLLQIISNFFCMSFRVFFNWNLSAHVHCWKLNYINLFTFSPETWEVLKFVETFLVAIESNTLQNGCLLMELVYCFPKSLWIIFLHKQDKWLKFLLTASGLLKIKLKIILGWENIVSIILYLKWNAKPKHLLSTICIKIKKYNYKNSIAKF